MAQFNPSWYPLVDDASEAEAANINDIVIRINADDTGFEERSRDAAVAAIVAGVHTGVSATANDGADRIDLAVLAEHIQDLVGAMVESNTETGIAVTYDDSTGKLNFSVSASVDTETIQDIVGAMVASNTEIGIAVTYDDATAKLNFDVAELITARGTYATVNERFEALERKVIVPVVTPGIYLSGPQLTEILDRLTNNVDPQDTVFTTVGSAGGMERGSAGPSVQATTGTWPTNFNNGTTTTARASQRGTFHPGDFTAATVPVGWLGGTDADAVPSPVATLRIPTAGADITWVRSYNNGTGTTDVYPAGDWEILGDSKAAFAHALMSCVDPDPVFRAAHALRAIEFIDAWSGTLTSIAYDNERQNGLAAPGGGWGSNGTDATPDGTRLWNNAKLVTPWAFEPFCVAASLIKSEHLATWVGVNADGPADFENMLVNVVLPHIAGTGGAGNSADRGWIRGGNWLGSLSCTWIMIGVYLQNQSIIDAGVAYFRECLKSTIFMVGDKGLQPDYPAITADCPFPQARGDGNAPYPSVPRATWRTVNEIKSNHWGHSVASPTTNVLFTIDGQNQETLRDMSHVMMGLGAFSAACETMWHQGMDLWGESEDRLIATYEFHAQAIYEYLNGDGLFWNGTSGSTGIESSASWCPTNWPVATTNAWVSSATANSINQQFILSGSAYRAGWELFYNHFKNRAGYATGVGDPLEWTHKLMTDFAADFRPSLANDYIFAETLTHGEIDA